MKNIKIGPKLIASFLFTAALTAFVGIYLTNSIKILDRQTEILYRQGAIPLGMLVKTAEQVQEMRINIWKWQRAKTDENRAAMIRAIDESHTIVRELIGRQRELVLVEAGIKILDNLQSAVDKFVEEAHNYAISANGPITGTVEDIYPEVLNAADEMLKALDAAIDRRVNLTKMLSDKASKLADNSKNTIIMLLVIALFLSGGLGVFLTISITRPLFQHRQADSQGEYLWSKSTKTWTSLPGCQTT